MIHFMHSVGYGLLTTVVSYFLLVLIERSGRPINKRTGTLEEISLDAAATVFLLPMLIGFIAFCFAL